MKLRSMTLLFPALILLGCISYPADTAPISGVYGSNLSAPSQPIPEQGNSPGVDTYDGINYSESQLDESIGKNQDSNISSENTTAAGVEVNETVLLEKLARSLLPTGIPQYGAAENLSFDNPNHALDWFADYDSRIDHWTLTESQHAYYVATAGSISCEFCCGAAATINPDGTVLCYCNHAAALRGAAKYMVLNTDMGEDQILAELIRWKTAWFPGPMLQKALDLTLRNETVNISSLNIPAYIGGC